jgi:hypothetical protein
MSPSKLFCLLACLLAGTVHADPELDRLKTSYDAALERAAAPVRTAYEQQLLKLLDRHTRAANLNATGEVRAELARIGARNVPAPTTNAVLPGATPTTLRTELEKLFVEKAWKTPSGTKFTFHAKGEGLMEFGSNKGTIAWRHVSPKLVEVVNQGGAKDTWYFRFVSPTEGYYGGSKDKITLQLQPQ